jgi:hypothetical protein
VTQQNLFRFLTLATVVAAGAVNWACSSNNGVTTSHDGGTTTTSSSSSGSGSTTSSGTASGTASGSSSGNNSVLTPGPTGYIDDSALSGIVGAWYGYGDMWGTNGAPPGNCQTMGMFMDSQCSTITFPMAPTAGDGGGDAAAVATFPPNAMGAMCLTGNGAKVIDKTGSTMPDYSDIFGIGIGLDFNNMGGTKLPWDATKTNVTGFEFDITGVPAGGIRVEFPTVQTTNGFQDSYAITVAGDGHYQADLSTTSAHKLKPSFTPPTGMTEPAFDPTMLLSIQFHVATNTTAAIPVAMMCVNNLTAIIP